VRDWQISDSDLSVRGDGWLNELTGWRRVAQEMACWLMEPVGTDPMYPKFGSRLHEMIGEPATPENVAVVRSEASRVLSNYAAYAKRQVEDSRTQDAATFLEMWGNGEVLQSIRSVDVSAQGDTVRISVSFSMSDGTVGTLEQSL